MLQSQQEGVDLKVQDAWQERAAALAAAQGRVGPDLVLQNGRIVNVYSGEIHPGHVAVKGKRIAAVGTDVPAPGPDTRIIDVGGAYLVPGLIEPHTHPWEFYNPVTLARFAVSGGTTTLTADTMMFAFRTGWERLRPFLDALADLPARYLWWVRLSPNNVTAPQDRDWQRQAAAAFAWPDVVGMGELPRWIRIINGEEGLLPGMAAALSLGKRVDGHTAGASPAKLAGLAAAGTSACHEAITPDEALTRLRLGYWTVLRFSQSRPDLPELAAGLVRAGVDTRRILLTTDGPTPTFLAEHGLMDATVRQCIAAGVPPVQAVQMATVNAATYLRRDDDLGGIAPGRYADIAVVDDLAAFRPRLVLTAGRVVAENGRCIVSDDVDWGAVLPPPPFPPADLLARRDFFLARPRPDGGPFPVGRLESTTITRRQDMELPVRDGVIDLSAHPRLSHAAAMDLHGRWITRTVLADVIPGADGVAHVCRTSDLLVVLGRTNAGMARAMDVIRAGGTALVQGDAVVARFDTPVGGFMSDQEMPAVIAGCRQLETAARSLGYAYDDVYASLSFLTADALPEIRLCPRGWCETKTGRVLLPPEQLA